MTNTWIFAWHSRFIRVAQPSSRTNKRNGPRWVPAHSVHRISVEASHCGGAGAEGHRLRLTACCHGCCFVLFSRLSMVASRLCWQAAAGLTNGGAESFSTATEGVGAKVQAAVIWTGAFGDGQCQPGDALRWGSRPSPIAALDIL
jgi:hypothetical protein